VLLDRRTGLPGHGHVQGARTSLQRYTRLYQEGQGEDAHRPVVVHCRHETVHRGVSRRDVLKLGVAGAGLVALGPLGRFLPSAHGAPRDLTRLVVINAFGGNDTLVYRAWLFIVRFVAPILLTFVLVDVATA